MTSTYLMTAIMLPILALMTFIGYYIFIPEEVRRKKQGISIRRFAIGFMPFLIPSFLVYMLVSSQSTIIGILDIKVNTDYTGYLIMIEGDTVNIFQSFATPALTYINSFIYLIIFSYLLIFTFLILIYTRNLHALEEFTVAFIIIYMSAFPFYIFFPVTVTGHALSNIEPLLYNLDPIIDQGVRAVDPFLDNDFPSLHAALSIMALMIVVFRTDLKRYKKFSVVSTTAILFSTLYLGIHWITDLIAGGILALISFYVAVNYREKIFNIVYRVLMTFEMRVGMKDSISCSNCSKPFVVIPHSISVMCPYCGTIQEFHPLTYEYT